jgi:outer membrane lipoprotein-sorting protein
VRYLRTLSTRSLLVVVAALALLAGGGAAIAVAAAGGKGPTPPPKALPQALHDALTASQPDGITARIKFTNNLFPSGALVGQAGSALLSGASGRLWLTNDGRGRLELQSDAGDAQVVWNQNEVTVYDASSNTVYRAKLPAHKQHTDSGSAPSIAEITDFLTKVGQHADVSGARPTDVAGRPAYSVSISPKHDGGLLGSAELAWDAARGVPLRIGIYAQGSSSPVLQLETTHISYGAVPDSDVNVAPPADAKAVDLGAPPASHEQGKAKPVSGLAAVQAAVGFHVVAPDTLVGLPRQDVRLAGKAVLVVYGQGLGAIVVVERAADTAAGRNGGLLSSLPKVSLDGSTGHELATQLGTVLGWQRNGVDFVLAGSLPPAAAETAARDLSK